MFNKKVVELVSVPSLFPDGTAIVTPESKWFIRGDFKHPIQSDRIFNSWSFPLIVKVQESALDNYKVGPAVGFRSGTFVFNLSTGCYYIIAGLVARQVVSPDALALLGLTMRDALPISEHEFLIHALGEVIA